MGNGKKIRFKTCKKVRRLDKFVYFDHWLKEQMGVQYVIRYMDDIDCGDLAVE
jgi:hypothetical protein